MKPYVLILIGLIVMGCSDVEDTTSPPSRPAPKENHVTDKPKSPELPASLKRHPKRINALENMPKSTVTVNGTVVDVWIANNESTQAEGMMYLTDEDVSDSQGMLFIFPEERGSDKSFWMQNTVLPLDILYVGKDKKVVSIGNGIPFSEEQVKPGGPYQFVLELKRGTAAKLGIKPGTRLEFSANSDD